MSLPVLLLANVAMQFFDGLATFVGVSRGIPEANPLIRTAMGEIGLVGGLFTAKLVAVLLLLGLYGMRRNRWVAPGLTGLAIGYTLFSVVPWTVLLALTS